MGLDTHKLDHTCLLEYKTDYECPTFLSDEFQGQYLVVPLGEKVLEISNLFVVFALLKAHMWSTVRGKETLLQGSSYAKLIQS